MVKLIDTQAQMRRGTGYWNTGRTLRKGDAARFAAYAKEMVERGERGDAAQWEELAKVATMTAYGIERLPLEVVTAAPVAAVAPAPAPLEVVTAIPTGRLIGLSAADLALIETTPATAAFFAA